jgi:hypothetical protein
VAVDATNAVFCTAGLWLPARKWGFVAFMESTCRGLQLRAAAPARPAKGRGTMPFDRARDADGAEGSRTRTPPRRAFPGRTCRSRAVRWREAPGSSTVAISRVGEVEPRNRDVEEAAHVPAQHEAEIHRDSPGHDPTTSSAGGGDATGARNEPVLGSQRERLAQPTVRRSEAAGRGQGRRSEPRSAPRGRATRLFSTQPGSSQRVTPTQVANKRRGPGHPPG